MDLAYSSSSLSSANWLPIASGADCLHAYNVSNKYSMNIVTESDSSVIWSNQRNVALTDSSYLERKS